MKQKLLNNFRLRALALVALLCAAFTGAWADTETVTFSDQGYSNGAAVESYDGTNFSIAFAKGTNNNAPKYYDTGKAIRTYGGNTFTVSSTNTITEIALSFASGEGSNAITTNEGTYENGTWTGSANSVTFTIGGTSGHRRIASVAVTYTSSGGSETPTNQETFSYVDYQGWANSPDYGKEITMSKTDVDITNNWFYTPQGDYHYIQFTATNGTGTITITPKNDATITRVEFHVFADYNGYQNDQTITPSTGTVSKNTEGTILTWEGSATAAFTLGYKSHIRWTSIIVTYTGGLPTCATPEISGETSFLTYSTVSITCATEGASIQYATSTDGVSYTAYQPYTAPFQISQTTVVKAKATKEGLADSKEAYKTFSQQGTVPNIRTFASTGAASQYLELHDALVTYKNGNTAYLEDAYGAIMLYKCVGDELEAGDKLNGYMHVTGFNPSYNGLPEITGYELVEGYTKTSGNTVTPTVVTLSQLMDDPESSPYEMFLSKYVKIEDATVTNAFASKNCTIEQGGKTIVLRDQNSSATLTSTLNDVVTITGHVSIYNTTKQIALYEQSQIEVSVSSDPTIIATPTSLTGFTYALGNGPSDAQSFTLSGFNLTDDITLSVVGDYEASTTENSGFSSGIVLSKDATNQTVYVRLKAGLAENASYEGTITLASEGATTINITLAGSVTAAEPAHFVWDLSKDETTTATTDEMTWVNAIATMAATKSGASTPTNNYYPGTEGQNYTSTRFYLRSELRITPAAGYAITSVVFTATTAGYATALTNSNWTNATAAVSGSTVTVTPTDGTAAFYAAIGGTCGFTAVKVYYEETAPVPSITLSSYTIDVPAEETIATIAVTYKNITNVAADVEYYEADGTTPTTYSWFEATIDGDNNLIYSADANTGEERTAYLKVWAYDDEMNEVYSNLITFTQAAYVAPAETVTYTLVSALTAGKTYVIASGTTGNVQVMGEQKANNRGTVEGSVEGTTLSVESDAGACEVVVYGPDAVGNYTLYDAAANGYLYAASSGNNYLRSQATNDLNGLWIVSFDDETKEASVVAQGNNTRNTLRYNSSNSIFSCYGSGQAPIYFFEKAGEPVATTASVKLNDYGYATFATTAALDFLDADAADFSAWQVTGISGSAITFEQLTGHVAAGEGILLKGTAGATVNLNILPAGGVELGDGNKLIGITAATPASAGQFYGLKGNTFVPVNAGTIPAGKAVIDASLISSSVKNFTFVFKGADGIERVEEFNGSMVQGSEIYNLAGQRVNKAVKGIYIQNGKKFIVK